MQTKHTTILLVNCFRYVVSHDYLSHNRHVVRILGLFIYSFSLLTIFIIDVTKNSLIIRMHYQAVKLNLCFLLVNSFFLLEINMSKCS